MVLRDFRVVLPFCVFGLPVLCVAAHKWYFVTFVLYSLSAFSGFLYSVLPHTQWYFVTFVLYSVSLVYSSTVLSYLVCGKITCKTLSVDMYLNHASLHYCILDKIR